MKFHSIKTKIPEVDKFVLIKTNYELYGYHTCITEYDSMNEISFSCADNSIIWHLCDIEYWAYSEELNLIEVE